MKNLIIGANWKSNKTKNEAKEWLNKFYEFTPREGVEVILFPPATLLDYVSSVIRVNDLPLKVGAQDGGIARDKESIMPVTGGLTAEQISEFAEYVLVGHSETRSLYNEDLINSKLDEILVAKHKGEKIEPILCISKLEELDTIIKPGLIVAYEPIGAIGSGNPDEPEHIAKIYEEIKKNKNVSRVMYGGSINSKNIINYLSLDIDGFLIGSASLDIEEFINILKNV